MSITRKVKFEYFAVAYKEKDDRGYEKDHSFDLRRLIAKAEKLSLESRTFDYYQEQARLDKLWYDTGKEFWFLNLARLRATNIPSKGTDTKELEPIELEDNEYIGEEVTALYDEKINVLMLQRNRHSLSPSGIEEYFNLLWGNENEKIYLRPIALSDPAENAKKAKYYRKFSVRFADLNKANIDNESKSSLAKIIKEFGKFDAINAEITVTMGRSKGASLYKDTVHESINEVFKHKDIVKRAELGKKDLDDTNVEMIDLFDHHIHDFLYFTLKEREGLGHEYVADRMFEKYKEKRGEVLDCLRGSE